MDGFEYRRKLRELINSSSKQREIEDELKIAYPEIIFPTGFGKNKMSILHSAMTCMVVLASVILNVGAIGYSDNEFVGWINFFLPVLSIYLVFEYFYLTASFVVHSLVFSLMIIFLLFFKGGMDGVNLYQLRYELSGLFVIVFVTITTKLIFFSDVQWKKIFQSF